jgi:hypothetical protein
MRVSSTYRAIFAEGMVRGGLKVLVRQGARHLGRPDPDVSQILRAITAFDYLVDLVECLPETSTWPELLFKSWGRAPRRKMRPMSRPSEQLPFLNRSSLFQTIIAEAELEGARKLLLRVGTSRFGPPNRSCRMALEEMTAFPPINRLIQRVPAVSTWAELLGPRPRRRFHNKSS